MKKILILGVFVLFVAAAFTSCKPRERCPAYGYNSPIENIDQNTANS
ncbi:MAG: hypothetical protein RBS19_04210 [Bacteroidales bacterium]|nr:hypothetical protein [Bacteroidales bacterium]MDY0216143.1 hypothetical protein [Bacteroidales bacterium]